MWTWSSAALMAHWCCLGPWWCGSWCCGPWYSPASMVPDAVVPGCSLAAMGPGAHLPLPWPFDDTMVPWGWHGLLMLPWFTDATTVICCCHSPWCYHGSPCYHGPWHLFLLATLVTLLSTPTGHTDIHRTDVHRMAGNPFLTPHFWVQTAVIPLHLFYYWTTPGNPLRSHFCWCCPRPTYVTAIL